MSKPKARTDEAPAPVVLNPPFPVWLPAVLLGLATIALYWPATRCDFVNFDDPEYITLNPHIQGGLSWESVKWAFVNPVSANWHPLTVLSHMLDCQLFGLNPWGHHLVNVLFHALNAALVFALLKQLTGATWRSFLVAALFAVHPLRVESVAWVSERKDVLSGFFGLLALIFYARYVEQFKIQDSKFKMSYGLALLFFTLGLMSKPMLVTWPFVLLLLDYWPLERFKPGSGWRLVKEKIPFLLLAAAASIVTYVVLKQGGAMMAAENIPLGARVGNALVSYCRYLGKMIWPADLAVFYPFPGSGNWPLAQVLLAGGLLTVISVVLFLNRRRYPFMLMGWLWFIGMLVPMIGLVQAGMQAMADRYTYLPSLGVLVLAVWGLYELTRRWRHLVIPLGVVGSAAIVLCMALTHQQLKYWQDTETLFRHALAVTENNLVTRYDLGNALLNEGRTDEAISQYLEAIRLKPDFAEAYNGLGIALINQGRIDEAVGQFQEAIRLKPDYNDAYYNLGNALLNNGQIDEAIRQFQGALRLTPDDAKIHNNLGIALLNQGRIDEAVGQFQEAIRFKPDLIQAHENLGIALTDQGRIDAAIGQFQEAIHLQPDLAEAHNGLGVVLTKQGKIEEAVGEFQEALRLKPDYTDAQRNLAGAMAMENTPPGH